MMGMFSVAKYHFNHLFFSLHLQYQKLCDKVISNEKGAVKGRVVFRSNDTHIYQMSDLLLIDVIYHLLKL